MVKVKSVLLDEKKQLRFGEWNAIDVSSFNNDGTM